jgi:hypothetical protein
VEKDAGDLIDAHMFAMSAVGSMASRFSLRRFEQQSNAMEGRLTLSAQFIQGVDICEVAISEALYSQAAALLKQELERLAAIDGFEKDRRKDGKTPNIGTAATSGFGPIYGDLNIIAHVAQDEIARKLVIFEKGEICGPSTIPQYDQSLARSFMVITCISSSRLRYSWKDFSRNIWRRSIRRRRTMARMGHHDPSPGESYKATAWSGRSTWHRSSKLRAVNGLEAPFAICLDAAPPASHSSNSSRGRLH